MRQATGWIEEPKGIKLSGPGIHDRMHIHEKAVIISDTERIDLIVENIQGDDVYLRSDKDVYPGKELTLFAGSIEAPVYSGAIVRSEWFDQLYDDKGKTFGASYMKTKTVFRVWSPVATAMSLELGGRLYSMKRTVRGSWERSVRGDFHGVPYSYIATVQGVKRRVIDPYTKALTMNSRYGVVMDPAKTMPKVFNEEPAGGSVDLQDSSIYELHIRDATVHPDSGVYHKGKYLGLTEEGTTTSNGFPTGLDYIAQLGVSHVQLLPVNDFARVDDAKPEKGYNWGYDPLFFQAPEGSYATDPSDPEGRIRELKQLVSAFHKKGLGVILDVVYNHVFTIEQSSFQLLVPGYYFRYHRDGTLSNGTGVGNDIATERRMVRKFILDTVDYWLSEYRIDGFRFDLMGVMDVGTMQDIVKRTEQESKPVMLLGEGWEMPTALPSEDKATNHQSGRLQGIRFFNDIFRDTVKGNAFHLEDRGYVNGNGRYVERMLQLVSGSCLSEEQLIPPFVDDVSQTVNYVECHDNHTLWDRLLISNPEDSEDIRKMMHQLGSAITLLSQGIPFIHAGQEFFRTKDGDENSYISGDKVNRLDWKAMEENWENVEWMKSLLKLRNESEGFRKRSKAAIIERLYSLQTPDPVFGWMMFDYEEDTAVYLNPADHVYSIQIPSAGEWRLVLSNRRKELTVTPSMLGDHTEIYPYECLVVKKFRA